RSQTGQGTQVKPNNDQTTTGTPAGTDNQNTQQGILNKQSKC
ncbi:hypothetical protein HMPREF9972_00345, partial [Staphylococcus epidermidis NIH04008]